MNEKPLRIFAAVKAGDIAAVQAYLEAGGDPDIVDGDGNTLLHAALDADTPDPELVGMLIAHGTDVNKRDREGNTPLQLVFLALMRGYFFQKLSEIGDKSKAFNFKCELIFAMLFTHDPRETQPPAVPTFSGISFRLPESLGPERTAIARALVEAGADVNDKGTHKDSEDDVMPPISLAAFFGENGLMRFFLEKGADIGLLDDEVYSAVDLAIAGSHMDEAHWLETLGGVSHKEHFSNILSLSCMCEKTEGTRFLLSHGADPNVCITGDIPLICFLSFTNNETMSRLLIEHGADVNVRYSDVPLLAVAIMFGNSRMFELLLQYGADVNALVVEKFTMLAWAIICGRNDMLRVLLERGADVSDSGRDMPALHFAVVVGRYDAARILLEHGADANARDEKGKGTTALYHAVTRGDIDMVRLLLEHGADACGVKITKDDCYDPPLFLSIKYGWLDIAEDLLRHGARVNFLKEDRVFYSSLGWAIKCSRDYEIDRMENDQKEHAFARYNPKGFDLIQALQLLAGHGADVNAKHMLVLTALHGAAASGREDAAAWLLDHGADITASGEGAIDDVYLTPLMSAALNCHPGMVRLLLERGADIRKDGPKILARFEEDADKKDLAEETGVYQMILDALGGNAGAGEPADAEAAGARKLSGEARFAAEMEARMKALEAEMNARMEARLEEMKQAMKALQNQMFKPAAGKGEQGAEPRTFRHAGDLARAIVENGLLPRLLELRRGEGEADWLEFKAAVLPDKAHKAADDQRSRKPTKDEYLWNDVVRPILAMRDTRGGLILIGVDDEGHVTGVDDRGYKDNKADFLENFLWSRIRKSTFKLPDSRITLDHCSWPSDDMDDWLRADVAEMEGRKVVCLCVSPKVPDDMDDHYIRQMFTATESYRMYVLVRKKPAKSEPLSVADDKGRKRLRDHFRRVKKADVSDLQQVWQRLTGA